MHKESITFTNGDRSNEGCCGGIHLQKDEQKVKIVLDNPMSMRKHFVLLSEAYSYALMYNEKNK